MADIEVDVKPASAVFIDVPNIAKSAHMAWQKLPWKRLLQAIAASEVLNGTNLYRLTAYMKSWHDQEELRRQGLKLGRSVDLQIRTFDDIDSLIIEDMWRTVAQHGRESIRNGRLHYPLQVRFVLVSGDSDYLRTIEKMRDAYGEDLELELYVFSWLDHMSGNLQDASNGHYYLDEIRGFQHLKH